MDILVIATDKKLAYSICRAFDSELESGRLTLSCAFDKDRSELNVSHYDLIVVDSGKLDDSDQVFSDLADFHRNALVLVVTTEGTKDEMARLAEGKTVDCIVVSESALAELAPVLSKLVHHIGLGTRLEWIEQVRTVLLGIAEVVNASVGIEDVLRTAHRQLESLIRSGVDFFVAVYDEQKDSYDLPFGTDEQNQMQTLTPDQRRRSLVDYVRRTGQPLLPNGALIQELIEKGEVDMVETPSESWMGVPLRSTRGIFGVMVVQRLETQETLTPADLEVAVLIAAYVSIAMERVLAERERKSLEAQLRQTQRLETIGMLASGIAHDFNNTLAPIMSYTEMALEDLPQHSSVTKNLTEVMRAAERAKGLARQILTFVGREESGSHPLSIQKAIAESMQLIRSSTPTTIEIRTDLDENCSSVLANPTQVHQVIMNLCVNASHAMKDGGVLDVSVRMVEIRSQTGESEPTLSAGWYVELTVSDTGHGMKPTTASRVFDPFFSTKRRGEGTGLGLGVVRGIVLSLGGDIIVDNTPGKGCRFKVYWPATEAPCPKGKQSSDEVPKGKENILLVDDDHAIATMTHALLSHLGYNVTFKVRSVEALVAFQTYPGNYDLIITDQIMPGLRGDQLINAIRRTRPEIPAIIITGFGHGLGNDRCARNNNCYLVKKPFRQVNLAQTVRLALDTDHLINVPGQPSR